jgi:hypothetical protein
MIGGDFGVETWDQMPPNAEWGPEWDIAQQNDGTKTAANWTMNI